MLENAFVGLGAGVLSVAGGTVVAPVGLLAAEVGAVTVLEVEGTLALDEEEEGTVTTTVVAPVEAVVGTSVPEPVAPPGALDADDALESVPEPDWVAEMVMVEPVRVVPCEGVALVRTESVPEDAAAALLSTLHAHENPKQTHRQSSPGHSSRSRATSRSGTSTPTLARWTSLDQGSARAARRGPGRSVLLLLQEKNGKKKEKGA